MISIQRVSKWYGKAQVLSDCTTSVSRGEVVLICGSSGSHKSTLIRCINALEAISVGTNYCQ